MGKKKQNYPTPKNNPAKSAKKEGEILAAATFSGPIPPPNILKGYETISPGLAERIILLAEKEALHRRAMEEKCLSADILYQNKKFSEARWGQICALIIGLAAIGAGLYASINGAQVAGSLIGGGGVIGLVSVFIYGRKQPKPNDKNQA